MDNVLTSFNKQEGFPSFLILLHYTPILFNAYIIKRFTVLYLFGTPCLLFLLCVAATTQAQLVPTIAPIVAIFEDSNSPKIKGSEAFIASRCAKPAPMVQHLIWAIQQKTPILCTRHLLNCLGYLISNQREPNQYYTPSQQHHKTTFTPTSPDPNITLQRDAWYNKIAQIFGRSWTWWTNERKTLLLLHPSNNQVSCTLPQAVPDRAQRRQLVFNCSAPVATIYELISILPEKPFSLMLIGHGNRKAIHPHNNSLHYICGMPAAYFEALIQNLAAKPCRALILGSCYIHGHNTAPLLLQETYPFPILIRGIADGTTFTGSQRQYRKALSLVAGYQHTVPRQHELQEALDIGRIENTCTILLPDGQYITFPASHIRLQSTQPELAFCNALVTNIIESHVIIPKRIQQVDQLASAIPGDCRHFIHEIRMNGATIESLLKALIFTRAHAHKSYLVGTLTQTKTECKPNSFDVGPFFVYHHPSGNSTNSLHCFFRRGNHWFTLRANRDSDAPVQFGKAPIENNSLRFHSITRQQALNEIYRGLKASRPSDMLLDRIPDCFPDSMFVQKIRQLLPSFVD